MSPQQPVLEGVRVLLRPMEASDVDLLLPVALEQSIWRFTIANVTNRNELDTYIAAALADRDRNNAIPFITMERRPEGPIAVGSTRLFNNDAAHKRVEIGHTWINPRWQRTRVNTEAKYLMLRYAFETMGYNRVEFKTDATNIRSRTAIARLGAVEEGTLRQHSITATGRVRDTVYFSIVAHEWPDVKQRLEQFLSR